MVPITSSVLFFLASELARILSLVFTLPCLFSYFNICVPITKTLYKCRLSLFFCSLIFFAQYYVFRLNWVDRRCCGSVTLRMWYLISSFSITWEFVGNKNSQARTGYICAVQCKMKMLEPLFKLLIIWRW